jgi:putative ABC transport system ATP-binding protein
MIEAKSIYKSYLTGTTKTTVLNDVSLSVKQGEFLFLVGPSGSGKSTLLSILGCVLAADSGSLQMLGQDVTRLQKAALTRFRRDHLGFVFQRFHLFRGLTAMENVRVPLDLRGVDKKLGGQKAKEMLASVGLGEKTGSDIGRLSMGQKQRVAVARALIDEPDVVFADEPTASLDAESGRITVELMRALAKERKTTVVVVTHDSRILGYADRVLHLENGKLKPATSEQAH